MPKIAETNLAQIRQVAAEADDETLMKFASDTAELPEDTPAWIIAHAGGFVSYALEAQDED